ncbi:MFS transporter [Amycolatopsis sp. NPDC006125]|uniref:MFS transporter n=1 Tax=Amycolatopsis sp. NPDC006125 TaxID=3156730 RepID=UPI0033A4AC0B
MALANREFRLLWTGQTTSMVGSAITTTALPLAAVVTLGATTFETGLLTAAAWLPWLLIGLPAGAWIDRLPKRPVMLACDVVAFAVFGAVPLLAALGALTVPYLIAAALVGGFTKVFFSVAYRAFLPAVASREELIGANAKLQAGSAAADTGGPGLAGLLAQISGPVSGILVDAATFAVSALCLRAIRVRETVAPAARPSLRAQIGEGLRFVARDRYLRTLMLFGAASNVALTVYASLEIVFLSRTLGTAPGLVGLVLALAAAGGLAGAAAAGRLSTRFGTARTFLLCQGFAAAMMLLGTFSLPGRGLVLFVLGQSGLAAGLAASQVLATAFRQSYCPPELLGRVASSAMVVNYGTIPLAALLGGALGEAIGVREALWAAAGLLIAALPVLAPLRRLRDLPARQSTGSSTG